MRRIAGFAVTGLLALALIAVPGPAGATDTELLANGGFELGTPGSPDSWTANSWGTNDAVLSEVADAHSGNIAARVTITSYSDGDAKWIPDAVAVAVGDTYRYSDWYESDATTHLWAQFTMTDGNYQYTYLGADAPAAGWAKSDADVVVPAGATGLSVLHVLAGTGRLTLDDAGLVADQHCAPAQVNGLPNGDFEDPCPGDGGVPAGWSATPDAAGTATYADTAAAAQGAHAESIDNSADGVEAGISTSVSDPASDERYALSFSQSGSTYVYAYLTIGHSDGTTTYQSLMSAPATRGVWSRYTDYFVTPADIQALRITIATSGVGDVTLDAVRLDPLATAPAPFASATVSLTFDDGDASTYANGFRALKSYGYRGTFYLNTATLDTAGHMTSAQVRALAAYGDEIGSHLYHHSDMVQLDDATLRSELSGNSAALQRILRSTAAISAFASPYGSYTSGDIDTVMQYATSHRTTDGAVNTAANLDPRQIHAVAVTPAMTPADIAARVRQAQAAHAWLVLVYHGIASPTADQPAGEAGYTVTPTVFRQELARIASSGVAVRPVSATLAALPAGAS